MAESTSSNKDNSNNKGGEDDGDVPVAPANNGIWLGFLDQDDGEDDYDDGVEIAGRSNNYTETKNKRGWKFPNKVGGRPVSWVASRR